jgi:hypothetical protein
LTNDQKEEGKMESQKISQPPKGGIMTELTKPKSRKVRIDEQFRVVINAEANEALDSILSRANGGFDGGEITRSDAANWIFVGAAKSFSESDIKTLRNLHFDERKLLHAILRKSGEVGEIPEEIKKALRDHFGLNEQSKKRASKVPNEIGVEKLKADPIAA